MREKVMGGERPGHPESLAGIAVDHGVFKGVRGVRRVVGDAAIVNTARALRLTMRYGEEVRG
jgi:hypothetical protein